MNKTTESEIETLFYFLDISVLKGELKESEMYLEILRSEFEKNENIFEVLGNERMKHLKHLGKIVDEGLLVRSFNFEEAKNYTIEKDEYKVEKEKLLSKMLCKNQEILRKVLKTSDDFYIASERQRVTFGEVDLVAYDNDVCYVIELKRDEVKHDIIGQIEKYFYDFKMKLIYKLWKEVKGVVIGNSFSEYAIRELSKAKIICLKYSFTADKLRLGVL